MLGEEGSNSWPMPPYLRILRCIWWPILPNVSLWVLLDVPLLRLYRAPSERSALSDQQEGSFMLQNLDYIAGSAWYTSCK